MNFDRPGAVGGRQKDASEGAPRSGWPLTRRKIAKRTQLIDDGSVAEFAYLLHDGWMCSVKRLSDGSRQVVDFKLPGDFVGFDALFLPKADSDIETITDVVVTEISRKEFLATISRTSGHQEAVLRNIAHDQARAAQHLINAGRRSALARTIHMFLELGFRSQGFSGAKKGSFSCPISQQRLADSIGLTSVHLNRVLRQLRESDLLVFNAGTVKLLDIAKLTQLAEFDPAYLRAPGDTV